MRLGETRSQSASDTAAECPVLCSSNWNWHSMTEPGHDDCRSSQLLHSFLNRATWCPAPQRHGTQRREGLFCMIGQASSGRMRAMALCEGSIARILRHFYSKGEQRGYTIYSQHYLQSTHLVGLFSHIILQNHCLFGLTLPGYCRKHSITLHP